ncbi:MAG: galactokinase [Anaerolineales bacterium]|nr:galactokinase [Anaerolineales bacterium]
MKLIEQVAARYQQKFNRQPQFIVRAPGRVNLLGEHVDYNAGLVLPAAIDRATYIACSPAPAPHSTLWAVDYNQMATFSAQSVSAKTQADATPLPEWAFYPAGILWTLLQENLSAPAMNAVFASDVPRGAGLSSSASVELSFMLAWQTLGGWSVPPMQLALLAQKAENRYVGVNCGIMDQFAAACGVEHKALLLDCRSLEWKELALPPDVSIVVADTTIRRKLADSEYNDRRQSCEEAVRFLQKSLPHIHTLRDVRVEDFNRLSDQLPVKTERRARHVVEEIERMNQVEALLAAGDIQTFGQLMNQCQRSLRDLYAVSCPELDALVEIAQTLKGCYGARLTGAGFGGCTVNLVAAAQAEAFALTLAQKYQTQTNLQPEVYITHAARGAEVKWKSE